MTATPAAATLSAEQVEVSRAGRTISTQRLRTVRTADGREAVAGRLIVGFRNPLSAAEADDVHRTATLRGVPAARVASAGKQTQVVDVSSVGSLEDAARVYRADSRVRFAEPDYVVHAAEVPNDPNFASQWGLTQIQSPQAWDLTHGSSSVTIAVLDCGIYDEASTYTAPDGGAGHPDVRGKVAARQNFSTAKDTDDWCDHGTHVAGIAAADTNNGVGGSGVGYNTRLLNGKVLDDTGSGSESSVANGMVWATDNGAKVINLSLGAPGACTSTMQTAVDYAWSHNVVVVAAAGNDGTNGLFSPASCTHVISVAATDSSDARASWSNYGSWVTVGAPGVDILSLSHSGGYETKSGTSMAAPFVSGLAGLVWATLGTSNQAVVDRITSTTDALAPGTSASGRINAARAIGCSGATLTFGTASPQVVGTSVALTSAATGCASAEFRFWQQGPDGTWTVIRDWSTSPTATWNTVGVPSGAYTLRVSVRATGSQSGQAYADQSYTLSALPPCTAVTLSSGIASPQLAGTSVDLSATATGCTSPKFRFWTEGTSGTWTLLRDWSPSTTFTWNTAGLTAGAYTLRATAAAPDSAGGQAFVDVPYTLGSQPACASATNTPSVASPQVVGTGVTFTATAVGCSTPEYRFWEATPNGTWSIVRDWSPTATFAWNTAGLAPGGYTIRVSVRQTGAAGGQAYLDLPYSLSAQPACTSATNSPDVASPQVVGTSVNFTATAVACPTPEYRFWQATPNGTWSIVRDWSPTATFAWNTTGLVPGAYTIRVSVRQSGAAGGQAFVDLPFVLNAIPPCSGVLLNTSLASPHVVGSSVDLTATASGCTSSRFRFWVQSSGGSWTLLRDWSSTATFTWNTAGLAPGTYTLRATATAPGSSVGQAYLDTIYVLTAS